jgi:hypothetical protein
VPTGTARPVGRAAIKAFHVPERTQAFRRSAHPGCRLFGTSARSPALCRSHAATGGPAAPVVPSRAQGRLTRSTPPGPRRARTLSVPSWAATVASGHPRLRRGAVQSTSLSPPFRPTRDPARFGNSPSSSAPLGRHARRRVLVMPKRDLCGSAGLRPRTRGGNLDTAPGSPEEAVRGPTESALSRPRAKRCYACSWPPSDAVPR